MRLLFLFVFNIQYTTNGKRRTKKFISKTKLFLQLLRRLYNTIINKRKAITNLIMIIMIISVNRIRTQQN